MVAISMHETNVELSVRSRFISALGHLNFRDHSVKPNAIIQISIQFKSTNIYKFEWSEVCLGGTVGPGFDLGVFLGWQRGLGGKLTLENNKFLQQFFYLIPVDDQESNILFIKYFLLSRVNIILCM